MQTPWQEQDKELAEAAEAAAVAMLEVSSILHKIKTEHHGDFGLMHRVDQAWQVELDWYQAVARVRAALNPTFRRVE